MFNFLASKGYYSQLQKLHFHGQRDISRTNHYLPKCRNVIENGDKTTGSHHFIMNMQVCVFVFFFFNTVNRLQLHVGKAQ